MGELVHLHTKTEPWLSKRQLGSYIGFSTRWIEVKVSRGMPSRMIGGQRKFQLSACESWLCDNGYLQDDPQAS